jgi:hypothetical protein
MTYRMLNPTESGGMKDLIRLHGADKSHGETAPSSSQLYTPYKEEIITAARLIEKFSGMKVGENFKKGNINVKFATSEEVTKVSQEEQYKIVEKFIHDPYVLLQFRHLLPNGPLIGEADSYGRRAGGAFIESQNTSYVIKDSIEEAIREQRAIRSVEAESEEGRKIKRFLTLSPIVHEAVHETIKHNNPLIGNWWVNRTTEIVKVYAAYVGIPKDEEIAKDIEEKVQKVREKTDALKAVDEGIAHYITCKVTSKLGLSHSAIRQLQMRKEDENDRITAKGINFVEAIERKTREENPVAIIIKHPPLTMKYIEHPDEYWKDLKEGKV